jgi:hypothetical protein
VPGLDYRSDPDAERPRTSVVGVLAAIGFAGLICIVLLVLATLYVTYFL